MTKFIIFFVGVCLILTAGVLTAQAQIEKKIVFPKGKSSAVYKGKLPRAVAEYDANFFRARRGQTLAFELITDDPQAFVIVFETKLLGPIEDRLTPEGKYLQKWSGKLPETSEYSVQIYVTDDFERKSSGKPYTLKISITGK